MLSRQHFLENLKALGSAFLGGNASSGARFYDAEFLGWLQAEAGAPSWQAWGAFRAVAQRVLSGPLALDEVAHWGDQSDMPGERAAAQLGHRFHGLMNAFSPPEGFDDPGRTVQGVHELIRSSEADYARCKPFIESIQRWAAQHLTDGALDMVDAGCGPHLFWTVLALCADDRVRVCALERAPALAEQATAFAAALGIGHRVHIVQMEATDARASVAIRTSFAPTHSTDAMAVFSPSLIVSETHCPLMLEEAGDQVLRALHEAFPRATLVPEGVELLGGCVSPEPLFTVFSATPALSFGRQRAINACLAPQDQIASLGRIMARDLAPTLDAQGRRMVGPVTLSAVAPAEPNAGTATPVVGTRLLFPFGVAPLEAGHSLGITEWLWAVPPRPGATAQAGRVAHLQSIFMHPTNDVLRLNSQTSESFTLRYAMGSQAKPLVGTLSSTHHSSPNHNPMTMPDAPTTPLFEITTSRHLMAWMAEQKLSMALTTYQIGKLFLLGLKGSGDKGGGDLSVFERTFNRCMGLCPTANGFYMSSIHQVWRFENLFTHGELQDGYDRLYVPQVGNTTGDLDIHDMAVDADGKLVFVNTLFGCLATLSETHSFKPLWRPHFISKLAAEDRCHLNGLALKDGRPAYVTAVGKSDVVDGWREHRAGGGIVMDVPSNTIIAGGLSMPHSPRWHQGKLWLLNSGTGEFGHLELDTGRFVPVTFCAGYMRGLYFHGDYALIGTSKPRKNKTFSGLALDENLKSRGAEARCGVQVVDLRTGDAVHWLRIEGMVDELYDVITLPGVHRPMALGFKTDEINRVISVQE